MGRLGSICVAGMLTVLLASGSWGAGPATAKPAGAPAKVEKYRKSTPAEDAAQIKAAKALAENVEQKVVVKFRSYQTSHFIIFTDWDPQEDNFLKENLEEAYRAVTRQFEISVYENIFIGRLPVFMFAKKADFNVFGHEIDKIPQNLNVAGYYRGNDRGLGYLVMWKPVAPAGYTPIRPMAGSSLRMRQALDNQPSAVDLAERAWAIVLTHELTHAFVARYHGDRTVVTWLNEGIAETVAHDQFPNPYVAERAKYMLNSGKLQKTVFQDNAPKEAMWYPVMETLVRTLAATDSKKFLKMFDAVKDGMEPEEALMKFYSWDYKRFEAAWRDYVEKLPDPPHRVYR